METAMEVAKIRVARRIRNMVEESQRMPPQDLSLDAAQLIDERDREVITHRSQHGESSLCARKDGVCMKALLLASRKRNREVISNRADQQLECCPAYQE
jgi:hypothetical protein